MRTKCSCIRKNEIHWWVAKGKIIPGYIIQRNYCPKDINSISSHFEGGEYWFSIISSRKNSKNFINDFQLFLDSTRLSHIWEIQSPTLDHDVE